MDSMDTDEGVYLKDTSNPSGQFAVLAGFAFWACGFVAACETLRGEWASLLLLLVPVGLVLVGRLFGHLTPAYHAVLYPDRVELPLSRARKGGFALSEVEAIEWPKARHGEEPVRVRVCLANERCFSWVSIGLKDVSREDRVTLIRYLRKAGAESDQENWPEFCQKHAVPLLESLQGKPPSNGEKTYGSPIPGIVKRVSGLAEKHPFLTGLAWPLALAVILLSMLSRKTWWTVAVVLSLSTVINIRLVWGSWASPFTEICAGFVGMMLVMGIFAPNRIGVSQRVDVGGLTAVVWLASLLIGIPLLGNAATLEWIPRPVGRFVGPVSLWLLVCGAPCLLLWKQTQREKRQPPSEDAEALRRWELYERTGESPELESSSWGVRSGAGPQTSV